MAKSILMVSAALTLVACANQDVAGPVAADQGSRFALGASEPGAVYVMTNATTGNEIMRYGRSADGSLGAPTAYASGGTGVGAGLGSQGAVTLSDNGRWLFAVNAASNDVSVFRVLPNGLQLTARAPSGRSLIGSSPRSCRRTSSAVGRR